MLLIIIDFFTDSRKLRMHIECVTVTFYVTHAHLSQPISHPYPHLPPKVLCRLKADQWHS